MASFTDIVPQFNPYVQQLPVEAIVKVGMAKQQAYEQNVTKIQAEIDRVAGLEIERGVDKKYLQSKLDALGNRLSILAGGDFSNFQLANSVGGMTSQIAKDKVIRTAVASTAWAKEQRAKIEKGKSDGTYGIENEDLYNSLYSKWLNGTTAGETFSTEYIPYKDVYKKLREIAKDVGVDESLVQNLFNADGTVNKVMIETYSKGKDPNKIYEAFVTGIDESDYRQLGITGRYKYKGYTKEQLSEVLKTSNSEYTQLANLRKLDLEQKIKLIDQTLPTLKKSEDKKTLEDQKSKLLQAILKINEQVGESNTSLNDSVEKLMSGDENYANGVRARIHTNKFLSTLSRDFADKTSYVKYHANPLWQAMMKEEEFKFEKWYKQENLNIEKQKLAEARKANKLKEQEILGYLTPGAMGGGAIATQQNISSAYSGFVNDRQLNYNKLALNAFGNDSAKLEAHVKSAMGASTSTGTKKTRDEVLKEIGVQEYTKIAAIINDKTKRAEASKLNPVIVEAAKSISALNGSISSMKASMEQIEKDAYTELGMTQEQLTAEEETPNFWKSAMMLATIGLGSPIGGIGQRGNRAPAMIASSKTENRKKLEKIIERRYSEVFSGFFPQNLGFVMNDKNRDPLLGKLNAALYQNPLYDDNVRKSLFENGSQIMLTSVPPTTGFGGTTYAAVISSRDGTQTTPIPITSEQYKFLSGQDAPGVDTEMVTVRARINGSPDGSTNLQGVGKWQTAYMPGDLFTGVRNYNIGGMDLIRSTKNPDLFYPILYVAPSGSSDYKEVPIQMSMDLSEGLGLPATITDAQLKAKGVNF